MLDAFEPQVLRVTVYIGSEPVSDIDAEALQDTRNDDEHELRQDSADPGAWALTFKSLGADQSRLL